MNILTTSKRVTMAITGLITFTIAVYVQDVGTKNLWYISIWWGIVISMLHGLICSYFKVLRYPWWYRNYQTTRERLINRAHYLCCILHKGRIHTHVPIYACAKDADFVYHTFRQNVIDYTNAEIVEGIDRLITVCEIRHISIRS